MTDTHIKINPVTPRVQYTGNGSTTSFPYEFAIFDDSDMVVYVGDEIIETGYTVTGAGETEGGNVVFDTAPADGAKITLLRNVPIERLTDFQEGGTFRPKNINDELDRQTAFVQQVQEKVDRTLILPPTSEIDPEEILGQVERIYNSIDNVDTVADDISNVNAVAGNTTNINAVAGNSTNINAVAGNASNINAVAGNATNINAVNSNKTNINTVAGKATEITTVSGIASSVTTVAGISSNVTSVAGNATNINTVAGSIGDVNDVADNLSNITAVKNNATNINAVAGNATNINAVAGNASNINSVASNSSNINSVATNISNVNTVASNNSNINTVVSNLPAINAAPTYAAQAKQWAIGDPSEPTAGSSKYWAERAHVYTEGVLLEDRSSNCVMEIPQDINLELNAGTLTLKAGSKVYVPNGSGVYDAVTTSSNLTQTYGSSSGNYIVIIQCGNNLSITSLRYFNVNALYSGQTAPTSQLQYAVWYDTTTNLIKETQDYGSTWKTDRKFCFPLCIISLNNGSVTSVDQVFNGFGYIGSTIFALPGVKGLIPNGRNTDGTLRNTEFTTTTCLIHTPFMETKNKLLLSDSSLDSSSMYSYDFKKNLNVTSLGVSVAKCIIGNVRKQDGKISLFDINTTLKVFDENDIKDKINDGYLTNSLSERSFGFLEKETNNISITSDQKMSFDELYYFVPNGTGSSNTFNTTRNKLSKYTTSSVPSVEANKDFFVFINNSGVISYLSCYRCFVGSTAPSSYTYMLWFDTSSKTMKLTADSGSTWTSGQSLPLAQVSADASGHPKSIKHLFGNSGFFADMVYHIPPFETFYPDGKDKNSKNKSSIYDLSGNTTAFFATLSDGNNIVTTSGICYQKYFYQTEQPSDVSCFWYNPEINRLYGINANGVVSETNGTFFCYATCSGGFVTDYEQVNCFTQVDRNEVPLLWATDEKSTKLSTPSVIIKAWRSGREWYRFLSDGTLEQGGVTDSISSGNTLSISLHMPFVDTNYCIDGLVQTGHSSDISSYTASHGIAGNCTTTQFDVKNTGAYQAAYDWRAIGKWK